jgi:hypothetical protein
LIDGALLIAATASDRHIVSVTRTRAGEANVTALIAAGLQVVDVLAQERSFRGFEMSTSGIPNRDQRYEQLLEEFERCTAELTSLKALLNTPEIEDFDKAVPLEAAHQS